MLTREEAQKIALDCADYEERCHLCHSGDDTAACCAFCTDYPCKDYDLWGCPQFKVPQDKDWFGGVGAMV